MTLSEFIVMSKVLKSDVSGVFKLWDKDKSGILDPAELTDLKNAMKLSDAQWDDIIERVDLDKDGKIDAREFILLCQAINKRDHLPAKKVRAKAAAADAAGAALGNSRPAAIAVGALFVVAGLAIAYRAGKLDAFFGKKKN